MYLSHLAKRGYPAEAPHCLIWSVWFYVVFVFIGCGFLPYFKIILLLFACDYSIINIRNARLCTFSMRVCENTNI